MVWPKSPVCFGSPPGVATSNRPPRPNIELKTKRSSVMPAAPKRPCRMSLPKMRGSLRLSSKSRTRLSTGAGVALTTLATGSSTTWFARRTPRLNCSLGSSIGSDASRGAPAHALRSAASPAALGPATQRSARRIVDCFLSNFRATRELPRQVRQRTCSGDDQLRFREIRPSPKSTLAEPLAGDYHPFATPPPLSRSRATLLGWDLRCVAKSAGWNSTAAESVVTSASAISLPMLDVPGWWENHRLPKAVAVVQALKKTARVRLDCKKLVSPALHAMT